MNLLVYLHIVFSPVVENKLHEGRGFACLYNAGSPKIVFDTE